MTHLEDRLASWVTDADSLALPGRGRTWKRWMALADAAGEDLALGRLAEGHADALAILAEGDREPTPGAYGVWAARSSGGDLAATSTSGGWRLDGEKAFCSGAGLLDRAVVTADGPDGPRIFDVDLRHPGVVVRVDSWPAVGMAASVSRTVSFDQVEVAGHEAVGPPGFYTTRIGFWWGAAGVAACWWGGARALVEGIAAPLAQRPPNAHADAAYGSAMAAVVAMRETLRWAAGEIDGFPDDPVRARRTARVVREVVHDGAEATMRSVAAAGGARPLCLDEEQSRRSADLYAYLAQHHVGPDAAALGRDLLATDRAYR
jgi:alkylation response protein AidB-like acyl-CoA dehydrogenase